MLRLLKVDQNRDWNQTSAETQMVQISAFGVSLVILKRDGKSAKSLKKAIQKGFGVNMVKIIEEIKDRLLQVRLVRVGQRFIHMTMALLQMNSHIMD